MTRVGMRGERSGKSYRNSGAARNALKGGGGLWHALLQWFVDELQFLSTRSDSPLLLDKAQEMRRYLIEEERYFRRRLT